LSIKVCSSRTAGSLLTRQVAKDGAAPIVHAAANMQHSHQPALLEARRSEWVDWHMATGKYVFCGGRSTPTVTVFTFVRRRDGAARGRP